MQLFKKADYADTLREAKAYLDYLTEGPRHKPDFQRLHGYLKDFIPHLYESRVPADLVRTVARLYFESERYQEAAGMLKRLKDPSFHNMRMLCDFYNGYFTSLWDWKSRQAAIWEIVQDALPTLDLSNTEQLLQEPLDYCFPTDFLTFSPLVGEYDQKGMILLGNRDGIYSLFPMTYLIQHMPEAVSKDVVVSLDTPEVYGTAMHLNGKPMQTADIRVRITPSEGFHVCPKVDLTVWHRELHAMSHRDQGKTAATVAERLLNLALPTPVTTLYVGSISVADGPFRSDEAVVSLDDLDMWFMDHGMDPDAALDRILPNRVYAFTRKPVVESRPRGDIFRGETCMPELEEIYFLRQDKGMIAFQRYGVGYWFLTIPKTVCGDDFPAFRDSLIQAVRARENDAVCFTGWAEGTRNCYIDFLSLSGISLLRTLERYCRDLPGGQDIRISTFYWNSVPRTVDFVKETQALAQLDAQIERNLLPAAPPKEQVSEEDRVRLERAFRETRWTKTDKEAGWDIDAAPAYADAQALLNEAIQYIYVCDTSDAPYDFAHLNSVLEQALPKGDAPDASEELCSDLSTVLLTVERYRESAKWASRTRPSDEQIVRLYTCDVGSDYPNGENQWEVRRQEYWRQFAAAESRIAQSLTGGGDSAALEAFAMQASAVFPRRESSLIAPKGDKKNTLITGLPGGILTLPAMLYFTSHYPASIGRRWNIAISPDSMSLEHLTMDRQAISLQDVQVSLTDLAGKVSLALWHPVLAEAAQESAENAKNVATRLLNLALPMGARLLYVERITVAPEAQEDAFPLPELRQQMRDRGYLPDVDLDALLSRRKYTISRQGQYNGRPRSDILRGETCMPELECIYNRLYEEGQTILERHGLAALFLIIPNQLCRGNPAQYRQQLQRYLTLAEGDKVFFTGWAEGSEYCYLDLISMRGRSLLDRLNEYALSNPGGEDLRFCTFYWNSTPRSWNIMVAQQELATATPEEFTQHAKTHRAPDFPVPGAEAAAALEASFHAAFTPEDFCAPKAPEAPAAAPQKPAAGKKKLSKAQRKAQNSQNNNNNGKKKR